MIDINNHSTLPDLDLAVATKELCEDCILLSYVDIDTATFLLTHPRWADIKDLVITRLQNNDVTKRKFYLSQSFIKSYQDLLKGNICGELFIKALTDKSINTVKTSPAMIKGQVFEYWATGQKNYSGEIPDTSIFKNTKGDLTEAGKTAQTQVQNWINFLRDNSITEIKTGEQLKYTTDNYSVGAHPDVDCFYSKTRIIIDLKYSDPDSTFGDFSWHDTKLPFAKKLLIQARHTQFILWKQGCGEVPFMFYIADATDANNAKARFVKLENFENSMKEYEQFIERIYTAINLLQDFNLIEATPELKFCSWCKVQCNKSTRCAGVKTLIYQ